jgi:hypothetical protein
MRQLIYVYAFFLLLVSGSTMSKDMTKIEFITDASNGLKEGLCRFDRFLECTEDPAEFCRAQMEMIIVPHCMKKYAGALPDVLTETQAQDTVKVLQKCTMAAYVSFNQIKVEEFSACMAKD